MSASTFTSDGGSGKRRISTRNLSLLPDVEGLRRLFQSMATLDAILSPEWESRYYSFNAAWTVGEQVGSMRNGCGDEIYAHFSAAGCWLKGFAHEYAMSPFSERPPRLWPGVLDEVPDEFASCLEEPAFQAEIVTFCIWRRTSDPAWQMGPVAFPPGESDPDGSEFLLADLDGRPETYRAFAADYYIREVDLAPVEHVYLHRPLTPAVVAQLNTEVSLGDIAADLRGIGYPFE